ncbi:uncharacterized protein [Narcine bancroftii]|uniref:uncharacterized protein isoform X2 n=1 Tax=Narcine bancroftii TaxID=1343680 RepID=UPI003831353A
MLLTRHQLRHAAQLQAPVGGGLVGCRWCGGKRGMKQSAENATQTRHRLASNSGEQNMTNVPELCAAGDCWDGIVAATIFIAFLLGLYTILWKCMSFQAKRDYAGQQFFFPQSLLPEKKIEDYDRQLQAEHKDHFRFAVGVGESLN